MTIEASVVTRGMKLLISCTGYHCGNQCSDIRYALKFKVWCPKDSDQGWKFESHLFSFLTRILGIRGLEHLHTNRLVMTLLSVFTTLLSRPWSAAMDRIPSHCTSWSSIVVQRGSCGYFCWNVIWHHTPSARRVFAAFQSYRTVSISSTR